MSTRTTILLGLTLLTAATAVSQDEQSTASTTAARYWTLPRIENISGDSATGATASPAAAAENIAIESETLSAAWDARSGQITLKVMPGGRVFLKNAGFKAPGGTAKSTTIRHRTLGSGKAIEITHADGNRDAVILFPKLPFAVFQSTIRNSGAVPQITRSVRSFEGTIDLGKPASGLKTFGTGGLTTPERNPGSYVWLAVAEPETRNGVVFGYLTHERGSGVLFSRVNDGSVQVGGQIDYGRLRLLPGKSEELELLAVGYFDDARMGLERWADEVAKVHDIKLKDQPVGYCTWYSRPHGGAADETNLLKLAEFAAKELAPFGFSVVQIDDGWQAGFKRTSPSSPKKDFRTHNPRGSYPSGMKKTADGIKQLDLVPGIWFMPFAGTSVDPFFTNHLDWFVKTTDGKPYDTPWGGTSLDMTHPDARKYMAEVAGRICRDWGYDYIKIDGLWTGTATRQEYVNAGYKDDRIGESVFHDPDKTNIDAYRDGLKLLRRTIGNDVFILGCNGPQNMRSYGGAFGLVDAMRVGPDNGAEWNRLGRGPLFGTRHYFMHGRVWINDPDPVYVRESMPLKHAQMICSWVAVSGQLNLSSEWLPGLPQERLDILKRTMPGHGLLPRPADLFDRDMPHIWIVSDTRKIRRDVLGLFNWDSNEQNYDYPMEKLGLDREQEYVAFDYWKNELVPVQKGSVRLTVPGESCRVIALRPVASHPQVISTSRHVMSGMIDVVEENWNASTMTLSGRSKVVGGDPYELRIALPKAWAAKTAELSYRGASGIIPVTLEGSGLVRATIIHPRGGDVNWVVRFK